jgi:hypothetical protein
MNIARLAALLLANILVAQVTTVSETVDRRLTRVAWHHRVIYEQQVWIEYGQPIWRAEYDARAKAAGYYYYLGKAPWTTLFTNVPLRIGDTDIAPGWWRLGVDRDDAGAWSLLLFDNHAVNGARTPEQRMAAWQRGLRAPLAYTATDAIAERLSIELTAEEKLTADQKPGRAQLALHWGGHRLTATVTAILELPPQVKLPDFAMPAADATRTTASGLRYEIIEAGDGEAPNATDTALARYVMWRDDGTLIDWSYGPDGAIKLPLEHVIAGMREGLALMKPGAVYRLVIPPELGYGDRAPRSIGAGATLVYHVELQSVERK